MPNSFWPRGTHTDVGVAAQRAFLHVAIANPGVQDDFLEASEIFVSFAGAIAVGAR